MRGKCSNCGKLFKFPFKAKNRFRICWNCGGRIFQRYATKGEYFLEKSGTH